MSFEPRVEARSLEASYNLTAQLRLEMVERRREEEVSTTTRTGFRPNKQVYLLLKVRAKARKEKEEKERDERGRRRRLNNPVWENIKADIEVTNADSQQQIIFGKCKSKQKLTILKKLKLCKLGRAYKAKHIKQRFFQNAQNTPRNNLRKLF